MALNSDIFQKFRSAFEDKCFTLIVEAYQFSLTEKALLLNLDENDITQVLFERINTNPKRIDFKIFATREEHLSKDVEIKKGFADKLPRVDLKMSKITSNLEYNYFFEAKRLKESDSKLKRSYIDEGMNRFTSKKYPSGCMLGFLLQGNVNKTVKGINKLLIKDKRNTQALNSKKNNFHKDYFESNHIEIGVLKHLIFDFTNMQN